MFNSARPGKRRLAAALGLLLALLCTTARPDGDMASAAPAPVYKHLGFANCSQSTCHGSATPWMTSPIRQNEYFQWRDHDPHAQAYQSLGGDKAKRIAAKLGLDSATEAPLCLNCHTDNVPVAQRGPDFHLQDGIGCEACHGGAEQWLGQHNLPDVDPMNLTDRGLYPTWKLQPRIQLCLGCHESNQRGATHTLFAAEHPLFSNDLPAYLAKWPKHFTVNDSYISRKHPAAAAQVSAQTDLQAATDWAGALAASEAQHHGMMPEFSFFQCDNCHRGIGQPDKGSTGQPRLNQEVLKRLLAGNAIADVEQRRQIAQRAGALDQAVLKGDRQAFYQAARALRDGLNAAGGGGAPP